MRWFGAVLILSVGGCHSAPPLELFGLEPGSGWQYAQTPVTIRAENVFPAVNVSAGEQDGHEVQLGVAASLRSVNEPENTYSIVQLHMDETGELLGVVPDGLIVGSYDLVVTDERGREDILPSAFEVTFSEVSRFDVTADKQKAAAAESIEITVKAIEAGSSDDSVHDDNVSVRVWMEPNSLVSAYDEGLLTIVAPGSNWIDVRESATQPVLEGVMFGKQTFKVVSNTEINASFFVEEIVETQNIAARGDVTVVWGQREDLVLEMEVQALGDDKWFTKDDEPLSVEAGGLVAVMPTLKYADENADPSSDIDVWFVIHDKGGLLDAKTYNPRFSPSPIPFEINEATMPPATLTPQSIQFVAWEVGRDFDLDDDEETACPQQSGALYSCSAQIEVHSGEASGLQVTAGMASLTAGERMHFTVVPVDAYGNPTVWMGSVDQWSLSQGVSSAVPLEEVFCEQPDYPSFIIWCEGRPTLAADLQIVLTDESTGWTGSTGVVSVLPGPVSEIDMELTVSGSPVSSVQAGELIDVELLVSDAYGNPIEGDALENAAEAVVWTGLYEAPQCERASSSSSNPGQLNFTCFMTIASEGHYISVDHFGVVVNSPTFDVLPGPLDFVDVDLLTDTTSFVAGSELSVLFTSYDAYGNRLVEGVSNGLDGLTSPASQMLSGLEVDSLGETSLSFTLFTAGETVVIASYDGLERGRSASFEVLAAEAESLKMEALIPWAWSEEPFDVTVTARDVYDNVADLDEAVTLSSANDGFSAVSADLVAGRVDTQVARDNWEPRDDLDAWRKRECD